MRTLVLSLTAVTFAVASAASQQSVTAAPASVLARLSLRAGGIQSISLPVRTPHRVDADVVLGGEVRTLVLHRHSVLAAGFKLLVDDGQALHEVAAPEVNTYRGHVAGVPRSAVAAQIVDGRLRADVRIAGAGWVIQPLETPVAGAPPAAHTVYRVADLALDGAAGCGVGAAPASVPVDPPSTYSPTALRACEMACDADLELYQRNGSSVIATMNRVTALMNAVGAIYEREVEICYRVVTIIVRTTPTYTNTTLPALLNEFQAYWNQNHTDIARDVAHLFSGKGTWSGYVGYAKFNAICNPANGYAVSRVVNASDARNIGLIAHELGHNWNATHCNSSPPCYLMCSTIGGCDGDLTQFSASRKNQIITYRNSRSCLDAGCGGAPGQYVTYGTGCHGTALSNSGRPFIGGSFVVHLSQARPNAGASLLIGASRSQWLALQLPIALAPFGAPGCFLNASVETQIGRTTNAQGAASATITVPNLPTLIGGEFYNQWVILDPANRLGIAGTSGGWGTIGG